MKKEPKLTFKSEPDKSQAIDEFTGLKNHPAWIRVIAYYDKKIEWLQKIIDGDDKNEDGTSVIQTMEDLRYYRTRRNMAQQFRNLPDILIDAAQAAEGSG